MSLFRLKIKKGDTVKILSGKDKGKTGKILRVLPQNRKVIVENVNLHTKFEKSRRPGQAAQKITLASPIPVSKVMLVDPTSGKTSRVNFQFLDNGTKQRIARTSGKPV